MVRNYNDNYKHKANALRIVQRAFCVEQSVIPIIIFKYRIKLVHKGNDFVKLKPPHNSVTTYIIGGALSIAPPINS